MLIKKRQEKTRKEKKGDPNLMDQEFLTWLLLGLMFMTIMVHILGAKKFLRQQRYFSAGLLSIISTLSFVIEFFYLWNVMASIIPEWVQMFLWFSVGVMLVGVVALVVIGATFRHQ